MVRAAVAAAALAAAGVGTPLQACTLAAAAELGALDSRWRETAADGGTLLREHGVLAQAAFELAGDGCGRGPWRLRLDHAGGDRRYDGRTTSGAPLQTRSDLREQGLTLQWLPLGAGRWRAGTRLRWHRSEREIRSTATALGYPERHDATQLALVLTAEGDVHGPALRWGVELAAGGGPAGRMKLALPGYDRSNLRLGSSRLLQAGLHLQGEAAPAWDWRLGLQHLAERRAAGETTALTRNGLVVGGVSQPATRQGATQIAAALVWRFGR